MTRDYYPYGLEMPGRVFQGAQEASRIQFQAHERDADVHYDYHIARYYDPVLGNYLSVDPLAHMRSWVSPYNFAQNNPIMRIDPNGEKDIVFNEDGSYKETIHDNFWHNLWFGTRGVSNNSDGEVASTFRFNNSDDADRFELDPNEERYLSGIDPKFLENNLNKIVKRGTDPTKGMSLNEKKDYIINESMAGGNLDYCCKDFDENKLYLIGGTAYDNYDAGNFVWGRSMSVLNMPYEAVKLGSEFNGFWNGKKQNGEWSPVQPMWRRITWTGDSRDDQIAILRGYDYPYIIFR